MVSSCNKVKSFPTAALSTSGIRVEGDSFLSACSTSSPAFSVVKIKTGETFCGSSCKKSLCHDFLRRHYPHQVKGSKFGYFLSACFTSSPVFISIISIHRILEKASAKVQIPLRVSAPIYFVLCCFSFKIPLICSVFFLIMA